MTINPSGATTWQLSSADMVLEAYERIQIRPAAITDEHMLSAARSANLELQTWANRGVTLFAVQQGTPITLVQGQAAYLLPLNCVQVLDTYYSFPNGDGTNTDRILLPMTRTEYAQIPQKNLAAPPNRYWFQRTATPTLTTWQVYDGSQPAATINYFYMRQMEDVTTLATQTIDGLNRFLEAFITGLTARLAEKFAPAQWEGKKAVALMAWGEAATEDREQGPLIIRPNFAGYYRSR